MLRASAVAEAAGVPTASLVCEGFLGQAATTASGLGMPNMPTAVVPGHVDVQSAEQLRHNVLEVTLEAVIENLTSTPDAVLIAPEAEPHDIVFEGSFDEVNRLYENEWATACRSCRRRWIASRHSSPSPIAMPTRCSARCSRTIASERSRGQRRHGRLQAPVYASPHGLG